MVWFLYVGSLCLVQYFLWFDKIVQINKTLIEIMALLWWIYSSSRGLPSTPSLLYVIMILYNLMWKSLVVKWENANNNTFNLILNFSNFFWISKPLFVHISLHKLIHIQWKFTNKSKKNIYPLGRGISQMLRGRGQDHINLVTIVAGKILIYVLETRTL